MHRSGTSVVSNLACYACKKVLLDDPVWAVQSPTAAFENSNDISEFLRYDAWKVPRLAPFADRVLSFYEDSAVVWILRDPLDVYSSILERYRIFPKTSMLQFPELGISEGRREEVFSEAFKRYADALIELLSRFPDRVFVVVYEDFFRQKTEFIREVCEEFLGWNISRCITDVQNIQYGPIRHKASNVKGPGRKYCDLDMETHKKLCDIEKLYEDIVDIAGSKIKTKSPS
nr:sulfotransferase [Nitratireductor arenosus]